MLPCYLGTQLTFCTTYTFPYQCHEAYLFYPVVKVEYFLIGTIQYLSIPLQHFGHKCKKAIKSTSTFEPPCIVHFKNTKNVRCILKTTISKSTKKRQAIGYVRQLALSPKVVQAMQLELSKFNTSYYLLILYLKFTYPKIANLIQILYIVCRALGCFKGGSCEKFDVWCHTN